MIIVFRPPNGLIVLQVLYAIGMSFIVMAFLRRLPPLTIGVIGLVLAFRRRATRGAGSRGRPPARGGNAPRRRRAASARSSSATRWSPGWRS
jgi:hypothetical protein